MMMSNSERHHRRSIRLKEYDYSQAGGYFVTICAHGQRCIFGNVVNGEMVTNQYGIIVKKFWEKIPIRFCNAETDWFVVMPNHIHGIVIIRDGGNVGAIHELPLQNRARPRRKMVLSEIVGYIKMNSAKQINTMRNTSGMPVWQRNYWEHVIRNEDKLFKLRQYVQNNPLKWHLDREKPERVGIDKFEEEIFNLRKDTNYSSTKNN